MKETLERLLPSDNRAVAPVLGVALLFAIAAIGLSAWQTTVIPQQNKEVEFDHYGDIRADMGDLRQAHHEVVSSGEPQSPTLRLGASYRPRVFGVNPPNPQGSLETEALGTYEIQNASVSASDVCGAEPQTDALRYDPSYNRLSDADTPPIVYESTVRYRKEGLEDRPETTQILIQGSNINILPVQSGVNRSNPSTSVTLASEGYQGVQDLNESAMPTLVVPTQIPPDVWKEELLDSQMGDSVSEVVSVGENKVAILLEEKGEPFPWTVRCAITTTGDTSTEFDEPLTPPEPKILNGGVGRGGITEHTPETTTDKIVLPNGKWVDIANIESIKYGNGEAVPIEGNNVQGEGVILEYMIRDGTSDEEVAVKVEAAYDPGNDKYEGYVGFSDDPSNDPDSIQLRESAARQIFQNDVDNGPDILDDSNYYDTFQNNDNVGPLVDAILGMQDATLQTTNVAGRVDMKVESGDLILNVDEDDRSRAIKVGETSAIEFDVTATGEMDGSENVDLVIRQDGDRIQSAAPRADRETLRNVDGQESFTLTWEPDWEQVDNGDYQILVEGESDQEFATVEVYQGGNVRLNVTIDNATSPIDYGDTVETNVTVENVGDTDADDAQLDLSMAGQDISKPEDGFDLPAGENKTLTLEYDTQEKLDPTNTGEKTLKATWNDVDDTETVVIERPDIILDPQVEDLTAGEDGQTQTFEFTLGEDLTEDDEISVDVSDTGDAVDYDGNDGSWKIVQGDGTELSPDLDNGKVFYKVGSDDSEGDTIKFQGSGIDASSADPAIRYDVEYRVESADSYAEQENGDTESTSFETTSGQQIEVEIVDSGEPIEYGETFTATVRATNEGGAEGDSGILLSLAGEGGPEETVQLAPGASTNVTMTYDTEQLDSDAIGDAELVADARNDTDARTVTIDPPTLIKEPTVEDVPAGEGRVNQTMAFTLGEDTDQAEIKIDLTNTSGDVSHDANRANWTIVEGEGSISLNANNEVESVTYKTNSESDLEGDRIVIAADYTDTTGTESGQVYDILYEVTPNTDSYNNDETNSTSFETT